MLAPGALVELRPEKPIAGGRMLARADEGVVLVAGAIPGERVVARLERRQQGVWFATTVDVLEPSTDRVDAGPDPACGGMAFAHVAYPRQCELKASIIADALSRIGRVPVVAALPITGSPTRGYRMRYRVHRDGSRLGFYREGSRSVCDPASSGQLAPESLACLDALTGVTSQPAGAHADAFEMMENVSNTERVVNLHMQAGQRPSPQFLSAIGRVPGITGVSWTMAERHRVVAASGQPWVSDPVSLFVARDPASGTPSPAPPPSDVGSGFSRTAEPGMPPPSDVGSGFSRTAEPGMPPPSDVGSGFSRTAEPGMPPPSDVGSGFSRTEPSLRRRAPAFFQANRFLAPVLARKVVQAAADGPVVDLYAGVGLFAICLAATGHRDVTAIEHDPVSSGDLLENAAPFRDRLRVDRSSVESFFGREPSHRGATLIVDPPRTGMSRVAVQGVLASGARRIVYVSCDVATLARDTRKLLDRGYLLRSLEALDLFPNTPHVEALAIFDALSP